MSVDVEELLRRVQRLEDIEAIKRVKGSYVHYLDDHGIDPAGIAALFAEDGVWEASNYGRHVGRKAIEDFFTEVKKEFRWAMHYTVEVDVEVDEGGMTGRGMWNLIEPCSLARRAGSGVVDAAWTIAIYRDTFVKVDGRWYFSLLSSDIIHMSDFDKGWVEQPMRNG